MKLEIDIPVQFVEHYFHDKFKDSLERVRIDIKFKGYNLAGCYECEVIEMLEKALQNSKIIVEK